MVLLNDKVTITQELKRNIIIRQLLDMGVKEYKDQSIYDLPYYDVRLALVIARIKDINIESDSNRWF